MSGKHLSTTRRRNPPGLSLTDARARASMHRWLALRLLSPQASEVGACMLSALTAEQADTQLIRVACDLHRAPPTSSPRPCCSADMEADAKLLAAFTPRHWLPSPHAPGAPPPPPRPPRRGGARPRGGGPRPVLPGGH